MFTFSVIIPTYNRAKSLERALNSLTIQTFKDFEVIVCDDGSTDDTKEIVDFFNDKLNLQYIKEENWGGPARPRNNGIKIAKGQWLCFLDSDDWFYKDKLEQINFLLSEDIDIIYHDLDIYSKEGIYREKLKGKKISPTIFTNLLINGNVIANSSVVVRKNMMVEIGGFSEDKNLISVEDYDAWLRLSKITNKFLYINKSLGVYWKGDDNISYLSPKHIFNLTYVFNKHVRALDDKYQVIAIQKFNFHISKQYFRINHYDISKSLLKKILLKNGKVKYKIKALMLLTIIKIHLKTYKYVDLRKIYYKIFSRRSNLK